MSHNPTIHQTKEVYTQDKTMNNSEAAGSPPKRQRQNSRGGGRGGNSGRGDAKTADGGGRGGRGNGRSRRRRNGNKQNGDKNTNADDKPSMVASSNNEQPSAVVMDAEMKDAAPASSSTNRHQFSDTLFTQCDNISPPSIKALSTVLNYSYMTKVQQSTLPPILQNHDVVAKAKTGSGKTTAFLLPILEKLRNSPPDEYITAVVLSPTRELTQQIAVEFQKLATFHEAGDTVMLSMIGGTSIDKDKRALAQKSKLRLLLATPGRLQDHLNQNTANIVHRLSRVQILCLDEADRLLDMGFRDALKEIISYMPREHGGSDSSRQTLLFSATFPASLKSMTDLAVKSNHQYIDTLDEDEADANVQVLQQSLVVPLQHHILAMQDVIQHHIQECKSKKENYKIIVFFTTARIAGFMAELFIAKYPQLYSTKNLWEIHSRKSQSHRMKTAQKFTDGNNCLLFSSDVSARGVDYPNVSFVLQVGAPSEKAQYIHRLGRTARAGNSGTGLILLCDFERAFLREVEDLDITALKAPVINEEQDLAEMQIMAQLLQRDGQLRNSAGSAYQAFMGYYNSNIKRLRMQNKHELVKIANEYSTVLGFPEGEPPALLAKTVGKMGLKGTPGLRIDREGGAGRGGGGGGGRGGGGRGGRGNNGCRGR